VKQTQYDISKVNKQFPAQSMQTVIKLTWHSWYFLELCIRAHMRNNNRRPFSVWTWVIHLPRQLSSFICSGTDSFGTTGMVLLQLNALLVTQPTVSTHWPKFQELLPTSTYDQTLHQWSTRAWQLTRSVFDALFDATVMPSSGGPRPNTSLSRSFS